MNMPQQPDPLAQLHDIHLPGAVSPWPPAPGWWILGLLLLAAIAGILLYWLRHRRRNRYRRLALQQLATLEQRQPQPNTYLQELNELLKRTALAAPKPPPVAGLAGTSWLRFLDRSGATNAFSQGPGRLLLAGPYSPQPEADREQLQALHSAARQWIRKHRMDGVPQLC